MSTNDSNRVRFRIGDIELQTEWNGSDTARKIQTALPIEATGNYWGGEIYFAIPVKTGLEPDAREVVEPGTVAYWPEGHCLCVFWGPTPVSRGSECRAASKVNIVGRVLNAAVLPQLKARNVTVEAAD
jgi:hypothetical protein